MSDEEKGYSGPRSTNHPSTKDKVLPDSIGPAKVAADTIVVAMKDAEGELQVKNENADQSGSVPRRRGFLSFLVVLAPSTADARQFDRHTKWLLTSIVSLSAVAAPLGSTILMR
jgi:hypothetical protein